MQNQQRLAKFNLIEEKKAAFSVKHQLFYFVQ